MLRETVSASSAGETPDFSAGESRNQRYQKKPHRGPEEAEDEEGGPPAEVGLERDDEEGCGGSTKLGRHEEEAEGATALFDREPTGDDDGGVRVGTGLADAEEEADGEQGAETGDEAGHGGEGGPPEDDAGEDLARAEAVAEDARWNLKEAVGEGEDAVHPAPADGADVQRVLHARAGYGDTDAIKGGEGEEYGQQPKYPVAIFHGLSALSERKCTSSGTDALQFTKRRMRMFITMPRARKVNRMEEPP